MRTVTRVINIYVDNFWAHIIWDGGHPGGTRRSGEAAHWMGDSLDIVVNGYTAKTARVQRTTGWQRVKHKNKKVTNIYVA